MVKRTETRAIEGATPAKMRRAMQVGAGLTGRRRCRMHGGADGSGAPRGSRNGNYKHGRYTAETIATRRWLRETVHALRELTGRANEHD
jgi:hypothetical protein